MSLKRMLAVYMAGAVCAMGAGITEVERDAPVVTLTANAEDTYIYGVLTYQYLDDGTIEVIGCDTSASAVVIPNEIGAVAVTSIGSGAFRNCTSLKNITIPNSVTSIGGSVFYNCTNLESVIIPDSVTSIGYLAFYKCISLKSVSIGDSVTSIGSYAFYDCSSMESITIPNIVTSIGSGAFYNCTSLISITIMDGVINIDEDAFEGCSALTNIDVSANNAVYMDMDGVLFSRDGTELICYPAGKTDTSYNVPDGVETIEGYGFKDCTNLVSITLSESVTCIDKVDSIDQFYIPEDETQYYSYAFYGCTNLTSISILNPDCDIYDSAYTISDTAVIYGYENSTAQMYAETYERTFVSISDPITSEPISTSFDLTRDDYAFENYNSTIQLSDALLKILDDNIDNVDLETMYTYIAGGTKTGHCYDMSALQALVKASKIDLTSIDGNADCLYHLENPDSNAAVDNIIGYYQLLQFTNLFKTKSGKYLQKTNEYKIEDLIKQVEMIEENGDLVIICFDFTATASDAAAHKYSGHAIVAYGIEYGSYYDGAYNCRILIADSNYIGFEEDGCIYIDTSTYEWQIPFYQDKCYSCSNYNENSKDYPGAQIRFVTNDMNLVNYPKAELYTLDNVESVICIDSTSTDYGVSYYNESSDTLGIFGALSADTCDLLYYSGSLTGDSDQMINAILPQSDVSYEYFERATCNFKTAINYTNSNLSVYASNGDYAIYQPDASVKFAGKDSEYTLSMIFNEGYYPTDWYKIEVSGENANEAKLCVADEGYIISSDSLSEGIFISVSNRNASASLGVMTEYDSIFVYEIDETTIGIMVDTDGDSIYESEYDPEYRGDTNQDGSVGVLDAVLLQRYLLKKMDISKQQYISADVTLDGVVNVFDLAVLKRMLFEK